MTALLEQAVYVSIKAWAEALDHQWQPDVHFEYLTGSHAPFRISSSSPARWF
jgi:hypothetical protein